MTEQKCCDNCATRFDGCPLQLKISNGLPVRAASIDDFDGSKDFCSRHSFKPGRIETLEYVEDGNPYNSIFYKINEIVARVNENTAAIDAINRREGR